MHWALEGFWEDIESWPSAHSKQQALDAIDDMYAPFLPCCCFHVSLSPQEAMRQAKLSKKSAQGPDGWTHKELQKLPLAAWSNLVNLLVDPSPALVSSSLGLFKRVPIAKVELDIPTPDQIRPIDVYSVLLRTLTSSLVKQMRPWLCEVLHHTQYAASGGAHKAMQRLNMYAERVMRRQEGIFALTIDFTKLYNMLCPDIAKRIASIMGLSDQSMPMLVEPLKKTRGMWRLYANAVVPVVKHERGLPQGMASSVILAEICLAPLIWKLHRCCRVDTICYVDDLTMVTDTSSMLKKVIGILLRYVADLSLVISKEKSGLWGSNMIELESIACEQGFTVTKTLEAMGMTWVLHSDGEATYSKERKRIKVAGEGLGDCDISLHTFLQKQQL